MHILNRRIHPAIVQLMYRCAACDYNHLISEQFYLLSRVDFHCVRFIWSHPSGGSQEENQFFAHTAALVDSWRAALNIESSRKKIGECVPHRHFFHILSITTPHLPGPIVVCADTVVWGRLSLSLSLSLLNNISTIETESRSIFFIYLC